ncbi:hypothetical protein LWI28_019113 [Acer negundo]|uniref:Reverse transcriptase domain-containing protein n=1 Tax=Acer negundo TaxID=4023 RepID=A0AAD5NL50_ACENE|nr:hypothetical protein LWI28_019113 [Acer negundo]
MPFGMSNAPSTFMRMMAHMLHPYIGKFLVVYFYDILIYSKTEKEHLAHLRQVFLTFRVEKLFVNLTKCSFLQSQVLFLGFIVSSLGIIADPAKVSAIREWPTPKTLTETFTFVIRHCPGVDNKVVDDLSRVLTVVQSLSITVLGLDRIKSEYSTCLDFGIIFREILDGHRRDHVDFVIKDGYLFRGSYLCLLRTSLCDFLVWEMHAGGLAGHLGRDKTIAVMLLR